MWDPQPRYSRFWHMNLTVRVTEHFLVGSMSAVNIAERLLYNATNLPLIVCSDHWAGGRVGDTGEGERCICMRRPYASALAPVLTPPDHKLTLG